MKCIHCGKTFEEELLNYICPHCARYNYVGKMPSESQNRTHFNGKTSVEVQTRTSSSDQRTSTAIPRKQVNEGSNPKEKKRKNPFALIIGIFVVMNVLPVIISVVTQIIPQLGNMGSGYVEVSTSHMEIEDGYQGSVSFVEGGTFIEADGFVIEGDVLRSYEGDEKHIVIPKGIKTIGYTAFSGNDQIESVVITEGVEVIDWEAFNYCVALERVEFPTSLKVIGDRAFVFCESLEEVDLKEGLQEIGSYVFVGCDNIEKIQIPTTLEKAWGNSFTGNDWYYEEYSYYEEVVVIGDSILIGMLYPWETESIVLPSGVKRIASEILYLDKTIKEVIIPEGVEILLEKPFYLLDEVGELIIEIPNSVTEIEGELYEFIVSDQGQSPTVRIRCREGSYAQEYALANGYEVILQE
ncbi:MAG: leucine-rich repeat domain-containing protein [Eubacteriales bacterium]